MGATGIWNCIWTLFDKIVQSRKIVPRIGPPFGKRHDVWGGYDYFLITTWFVCLFVFVS